MKDLVLFYFAFGFIIPLQVSPVVEKTTEREVGLVQGLVPSAKYLSGISFQGLSCAFSPVGCCNAPSARVKAGLVPLGWRDHLH